MSHEGGGGLDHGRVRPLDVGRRDDLGSDVMRGWRSRGRQFGDAAGDRVHRPRHRRAEEPRQRPQHRTKEAPRLGHARVGHQRKHGREPPLQRQVDGGGLRWRGNAGDRIVVADVVERGAPHRGRHPRRRRPTSARRPSGSTRPAARRAASPALIPSASSMDAGRFDGAMFCRVRFSGPAVLPHDLPGPKMQRRCGPINAPPGKWNCRQGGLRSAHSGSGSPMPARDRTYGCPVEVSLDLLGGKWKTILPARLKERPLRYGELRALSPDLSDKVLTQRLRDLEADGFVSRSRGPQVRYALTDLGRSLHPALEALYAWGQEAARRTGARVRPAPPPP